MPLRQPDSDQFGSLLFFQKSNLISSRSHFSNRKPAQHFQNTLNHSPVLPSKKTIVFLNNLKILESAKCGEKFFTPACLLLDRAWPKTTYEAKFIYEPNSNGVVIEMTASLMEFVFQSDLCIAEDRIGKPSHRLPRKMVPFLVKNNTRI